MVFNSKSRVITLIVLSSFFFLLILNYHVFSIFSKQLGANLGENDPFGIKKIYPTKQGGREWFMNMSNPKNDPNVSFTFNPNLLKQNDSSWKLDKNDKVRINVETPDSLPEWKNVEITGYVKIDSLVNPNDTNIISDIDWVSRTDRHNENLPCYGLSLHGGIYPDGTVAWKKEIWFTGGYTKENICTENN